MNPLLTPLAAIYRWGAGAKSSAYERGWLKSQRLSRPVISVGNLTTGGTGKTPLVALIARLLLKRGRKPAILTRGYRRRGGPSLVVIEPAAERSPDPRQVGDEPAWLAGELPEVPIVVSADRFRGGCYAGEHFQSDVYLLDDGFQHQQLARNVDVVALDVTQELSDRAVLPAGRQREACAALKRAQLVVLTRTSQADAAPWEERVGKINPQAKVFHSRSKLCGWLPVAGGPRLPADFLKDRRALAFCGIGNPGALFHDLGRWGIDLAGTQVFRDHHAYTDVDLARLVLAAQNKGATLVTTEKDMMNLPASWKQDLTAFACLIEAEILELDAFEKALFALL
jgi:tetraacyldisaccharide 4'-kinase